MAQTAWTEEEIYLVMERGHSLALQGLYLEAARIFAGVLAIDNRNRYCRNALATLILLLGDPQNALAVAEEGLQQMSGEPVYHARRAEALIALRRFHEAQAEVRWLAENSDESALQPLILQIEAGTQKSSLPRATSPQQPPIIQA
jgi:thioredoxin-like negative regulator of GroEL